MDSSRCTKCEQIFLNSPLLQGELRHHALIFGPQSAEVLLNEKLREDHSTHGR